LHVTQINFSILQPFVELFLQLLFAEFSLNNVLCREQLLFLKVNKKMRHLVTSIQKLMLTA